jgi:hypothetical protein
VSASSCAETRASLGPLVRVTRRQKELLLCMLRYETAVGSVLQLPATSSNTLGCTRARSRLLASGMAVDTVLHKLPPTAAHSDAYGREAVCLPVASLWVRDFTN